MQIHLTTTKAEAMTHIRSLMKTALTGHMSDRTTFSKLNGHYGAIGSLQGETVEELFNGVSSAADSSRKTSEILDIVGTAGLFVMIFGMGLAAVTSLGIALTTFFIGSICFLVGGFGSAITGATAEEKEKLVDHLDWLCSSCSSGIRKAF
jgi:hypothetical protein